MQSIYFINTYSHAKTYLHKHTCNIPVRLLKGAQPEPLLSSGNSAISSQQLFLFNHVDVGFVRGGGFRGQEGQPPPRKNLGGEKRYLWRSLPLNLQADSEG